MAIDGVERVKVCRAGAPPRTLLPCHFSLPLDAHPTFTRRSPDARPSHVQVRPQKIHKRGQRTGKQQKRKMKGRERALAVAERTSTKLSKGGKKQARKKSAKGLY